MALFCVLSGTALVQAVSLKLAAVDGRVAVDLYQATVQLQEERRLALIYLGESGDAEGDALRSQFVATDGALRDARERAQGLTSRGAEEVRDKAETFLDTVEERDVLREEVLNGEQDQEQAFAAYNTLVESGHGLFDATGRTVVDPEAVAMASATQDVVRGQEALARADSVLSGAAAVGELTPEEQARFTGLVEHGWASLAAASGNLTTDNDSRLRNIIEGPDADRVQNKAEEITTFESVATTDAFGVANEADRTLPVDVEEWRSAMDGLGGELVQLADTQWHDQLATADAAGTNHLTWSVGGAIFSLFAAALAYGVASRSSKELIGRLRRLRREALDRAERDLPRIVGQLERGEQVDPGDDVQPLDHGSDEIGEVAKAFNAAQRTAVAAAVRQAEIREGANRVFLAIAHRNQSLVQRQLELLDRIERDQDDPDLLAELFQLDHLATRGRRHAENLIILGNGRPGRQWREPVPLTDVIRGAISETEEYARIKLRDVPKVSIVGSAVADIIHLVAELAENATSFSPPHTVVHIYSELVPKGLVVEIEDRGLGMDPEDVDRANRTFASPPQFDVVAPNHDSRLGLFVVARLAAKHGIAVQLRGSPYGGMRAIVLIPTPLVAHPQPAQPVQSTQPTQPTQPTQRTQSAPHVPAPTTGDVLYNGHGDSAGAGSTTQSGAFVAPATRHTHPDGVPSAEVHHLGGSRPPGHPPERVTPTVPGEDRPPLPRRQRQASLAPQLKSTTRAADEQPTQRPASSVRQTMAALQNGTRRGREGGADTGATPAAGTPIGPPSGTQPGTGPGTERGTGPGAPSGTQPDSGPGAPSGTQPESGPGAPSGTQPESGPGAQPGTEPGTEPQQQRSTGQAERQPGQQAEQQAGQGTRAEPVHGNTVTEPATPSMGTRPEEGE